MCHCHPGGSSLFIDFKTYFICIPLQYLFHSVNILAVMLIYLCMVQVCIFAYGQTGSGKTYTMMGKPGRDQKGIIPRSLEQIFKTSQSLESQGWKYCMQVSPCITLQSSSCNDILSMLLLRHLHTGINVGNIQ